MNYFQSNFTFGFISSEFSFPLSLETSLGKSSIVYSKILFFFLFISLGIDWFLLQVAYFSLRFKCFISRLILLGLELLPVF